MHQLTGRERTAALQEMAADGVDILVVGGGITGAGVALDAAARGYRVGLVERADFASGTSSKSTKLVHGGIRYLPQFDLPLVYEGLVERGLLLRNAPFLVQPIGFVLPLYADTKRPLGTPIVLPGGIGMSYLLQAGLLLYDLLALGRGGRRHRRLGPRHALRRAPCLKAEGLVDAFIYYDGQTDDTRLTATVIRTAAQHGALVANYAELFRFEERAGRIVAAQVRDRLTETTVTVRAGMIVNAAGVWAGRVEALASGEPSIVVKPAKGVHLTVPRRVLKLSGRDALVLPETDDGRLLFLVPWGPRVTIGTTDTPGGDIDAPRAAAGDVAYLLRHVNRYMRCRLTEADIISTWAGYRPLVSSNKPGLPSSRLSRTHAVVDGPGGMVTVVGGKLTTYRRMAEDTLDHVSRRLGDPIVHTTAHLPLAGTVGRHAVTAALAAAAPVYGLHPDTLRRLQTYGAAGRAILDLLAADATLAARLLPDLPYIAAEVVFACRYEMAMTVDDVLERRLHVSFEDWARGAGVAPVVAARMAPERGWDAAETSRQVARYRRLVAGQDNIAAPGPHRHGAEGGQKE